MSRNGNQILRFQTNVPTQLALQTTQGLRIEKKTPGRYDMLFVTVSGQRVYFDQETAAKIQRLVRSDEPFMVCKRRGRYDVWLSNAAERQRAAEEAPAIREFLSSNEVESHAPLEGAAPSGRRVARPEVPMAVPATPKTDGQPGETGTVIPFPAPRRQEPLKPTGTDSLPVPRLQPYAGGAPEALGNSAPNPEDDSGLTRPGRSPVRIRPASAPPSRPKPPGRIGYRQALREICATVKDVLAETNLQLGDAPTQDLISTVFIAAQKDKAIDFDFGEAA